MPKFVLHAEFPIPDGVTKEELEPMITSLKASIEAVGGTASVEFKEDQKEEPPTTEISYIDAQTGEHCQKIGY